MPPGFPKGSRSFTTAKVIVARAFAPAIAELSHTRTGRSIPAQSEHATHVAGHRRGQPRNARAAAAPEVSGVAPKAYLGNYKVLTIPTPGFGLNGNSPGDRRRHRGRRRATGWT